MINYLIRRLIIFIPTLLVVSLIAFGLSKLTPGDPVVTLNPALLDSERYQSVEDRNKDYLKTAARIHLDKAPFYFSVHALAFPDTMYKIFPPLKRETLNQLIQQSGNWEAVQNYQHKIKNLQESISQLPDSLITTNSKSLSNILYDLNFNAAPNVVDGKLEAMQLILDKNVPLIPYAGNAFMDLRQAYRSVEEKAQRWKLYLPTFRWYGFKNQYHIWISNFLKGDFGTSYIDRRPVAQKIWSPLLRTLLMNFIAIVIAYSISIPLGVRTAIKKGKFTDRLVTFLLFMLYSLPTFWIGTLLIIFFTNSEYGMDWFPTLGLSSLADEAPFWSRFWDTAHHLVLPIFCLTYGAFAFITRQMRNSTDSELSKLYITSARARGLSLRQATWKHAFKNALFPIITLFASIFPALLSGTFVVEYIFNIPGLGLTTINAINNSDWPVVYTVLMLSSVFTILGILVADILYFWLNPRVSFK